MISAQNKTYRRDRSLLPFLIASLFLLAFHNIKLLNILTQLLNDVVKRGTGLQTDVPDRYQSRNTSTPRPPSSEMSASTSRVWPRRLLHLASMTSLERTEGNQYGDFVEPEYGALSYTWGRYEVPDGPHLKVSGVNWTIPAIREDHFTVGHFAAALKKASASSGLIWVDVACINQENELEKLDEIGKQAGIFRSAKHVCAWLTSLTTSEMQSALEDVELFSKRVTNLTFKENSFVLDDVESLLRDESLVKRAEASLGLIFQDPWFSSLWTLQEAYLSKTATFLSESAGTAPFNRPYINPTKERDLMTLVGDCESIKLILMPYGDAYPSIRRILQLVEKSGLTVFNSIGRDAPAAMLYCAATYRETTKPLDRIYGIMQAYDLRLGASAQPGWSFTLTELEDQLGAALNHLSPFAAQLHVHTQPQEPDKAWRVGQHSLLPDTYYISEPQDARCKINVDTDRRPRFSGFACSIPELVEFWTKATEQQNLAYPTYVNAGQDGFFHYQANIHLDATVEYGVQFASLAHQPRASCGCRNCQSTPVSPSDPVEAFLKEFPQSFSEHRILFLGNIILFRFTGPGRSFGCAARAGILVRKQNWGDKEFWQRVGICSWEKNVGVKPQEPDCEGLWNEFEDFLG
jgi:hypothetical protein